MLLQSIRDRATGWIAWIIVILISIPFALWGIQEYLSPTSSVAVATVNGADVGIESFRRVYQRQRAQLQAVFGPNFDLSQLDDERLREEALSQLLNEEVVLQAGYADGMRVGDQQLAIAIQSQPTFQRDGVFSQELYEQWLRTQGYSSGGFEFELRRSMLSEQVVSGIANSAFSTTHELSNAIRLQRQKRRFDTLTVPVASFRDLPIDDAAIEAYYEANQADYVIPQQVRIEYLEISRDAIAGAIAVDDEELALLYEQRKENFKTPERREASHILLRLDLEADEAAVAAARDKLMELKKQYEGGAPFEDLAREHSQDPGSAKQGGVLGSFGKGVMDPAFETAAFSLEKDQVSDPVRSSFGMHLVKVTAIHRSAVKSFEEVRDDLRAEQQREESEQIFVEQVDSLATLAFEHPESLEVAADTLGLTPEVSDWLSPIASANSGIGVNHQVVEAAFSPEVLEEGNNSDVIELDVSRFIALRIAEHRPSRQEPLDAVRDPIREELVDQEARKLAAESGRKLLEKLRGGEHPQSIAEGAGLDWSGDKDLERHARNADAVVLNRVFRMPRPSPGDPTFDGTVAANGDFVVIALSSVQDGSLDQSDEAERDTAKTSLSVEIGRNDYNSVVRALRDQADVVVFRDNL